MPDKKLTDAEIKKALEELRANLDDGYSTALMWGGKRDIEAEKAIDLYGAVLDLINRLQGTVDYMTEQRDIYMQDATDFSRKVDRLQAENENLQEKNLNLTSDLTSLQNDLTSLQAENEEQGETISSLEREIEKLYYELDLRIQEKRVVEAKARKEFAERLISEHSFEYYGDKIVLEADIYDLLKETEGDDK